MVPLWSYLCLFEGYVGASRSGCGAYLGQACSYLKSCREYHSVCYGFVINWFIKMFSLCSCRAIMQHLETSMSFTIKFAQLIEMYKSLSFGPCRARTQHLEISMPSNMDFEQLMEMHKSPSLGPCRARTQRLETLMTSYIQFTQPIEVHQTLSLGIRRAKNALALNASPTHLISVSPDSG